MRKILLIIIAVVASPFASGLWAKHRLVQLVETANENPYLTITEDSYKSGWLKSEAKYKVSFNIPNYSQDKQTIDVDMEIYHGPVIFDKHASGQFAWADIVVSSKALQKELPVTVPPIHMLINYDGTTAITSGNKNGEYINFGLGPISFKWNNFYLDAVLSKNFDHSKSAIQLGSIDLILPQYKVEVVAGDLTADSQKTSYGFWIGNSSLDIPSVTFNGQKMLENLELSFSSNLVNALASTSINFDVATIGLGKKQYGPIELKFNMGNINPTAFEKIIKISQEIQVTTNNDQLDQYNTQLLQAILEMFSKNFQVGIDPLSITTPDGVVKVELNLDLPSFDPNGDPKQIMSEIPAKINANLDVSVPQKMLEIAASAYSAQANKLAYQQLMLNQSYGTQDQAGNEANPPPQPQSPTQVMQSWIENHIVVQDGDGYRFTLELKDGNWQLNGKPLDQASMVALIQIVNAIK